MLALTLSYLHVWTEAVSTARYETQDTNNHAGTQDDSDSESDEQLIVVPSFPSNHFSGPEVNPASDTVESNSDYAEELARLQRQEYEANSAAKDTWGSLKRFQVWRECSAGYVQITKGKSPRSYAEKNAISLINHGRIKKDAKYRFRNKARFVAQGHRQEEGIDYDEVFAPVARIEAIRLFLAFASYMGFMYDQMDVKSAFSMEMDEEVMLLKPKVI
ncbi:putative ribonuclease H-like domain-containing protein [Tanacetum coccineum]